MDFYKPPINQIIAGVLVLVGVYSAARGARRVARGLGQAAPLEVVRGLRGCAVALAVGAFAAGILTAQTWFLIFGAIFLGEELYETGILAVIIRSGERWESEEQHLEVLGAPSSPSKMSTALPKTDHPGSP